MTSSSCSLKGLAKKDPVVSQSSLFQIEQGSIVTLKAPPSQGKYIRLHRVKGHGVEWLSTLAIQVSFTINQINYTTVNQHTGKVQVRLIKHSYSCKYLATT